MAQELVVFTNQSGASRPGHAADVARYSDAMRITIGTLYIVGGLVGGTVCIVVPVAHLITTWALPLGGILMGVRAFKRGVVIYQPAGVCPSCDEPIELVGGSIDDRSWQTCPKCKAELRILAGETARTAASDVPAEAPATASLELG